MQWFLIRRLIDILLCGEIGKVFAGCSTVLECIHRFLGLSFFQQIGIAVCMVVVATSAYELVAASLAWTRNKVRNYIEREKKALPTQEDLSIPKLQPPELESQANLETSPPVSVAVDRPNASTLRVSQ